MNGKERMSTHNLSRPNQAAMGERSVWESEMEVGEWRFLTIAAYLHS